MADDLDYLTLWFGWNDYAYSTLGTINDTEDTTFYGAWNKVLPALIQKYPLCKIGLIVPYGTNADFRQAVRDVGIKWGLPVLDLYSNQVPLVYFREGVDSTIQNLRRSTFTDDGTHPNQAGHYYISTFYENFLRSL
jgi:lysophospholipase L1-like esterase